MERTIGISFHLAALILGSAIKSSIYNLKRVFGENKYTKEVQKFRTTVKP